MKSLNFDSTWIFFLLLLPANYFLYGSISKAVVVTIIMVLGVILLKTIGIKYHPK